MRMIKMGGTHSPHTMTYVCIASNIARLESSTRTYKNPPCLRLMLIHSSHKTFHLSHWGLGDSSYTPEAMTTIMSYATVSDPMSAAWIDRATIIGFDIAYAAYGVHATLFFLCFTQLWAQRKSRPRSSYAWMAYISALFILGSVANGIDMHMGQVIFVDNRTYPGGPGAYASTTFTVPINIICTIACVIGAWLQDALLIFRFYMIVSPPWWLLAVPICTFLTSVVMSLLLLAQLTHPGSTIWQRTNVNIELVYWSTTIGTNVLLTILIVGYLMRVRRSVMGAVGNHAHVPYLSVSAMLIEAAFLYTAFSLAFLIPYAMGSTVNILFFSLISQVQYITPLLIILRVAQGRAYTRQYTATHIVSTIRWAGQLTASAGGAPSATQPSEDLNFRTTDSLPFVDSEKASDFVVLTESNHSTSDSRLSEVDGAMTEKSA